jgi:endonuclease YncB( thermonuclease family)
MWKALFALVVALLTGCASTGLPQPPIDQHEEATSSASQTGLLVGIVVGVTDGDTITVLDDQRTQHKIRLAGIDAPEKAQAFGQRSKEYLSSLVFGRQVLVEEGKRDRYGRTVGKVVIDGRDANLAMVVAGLAWHYKKYQGEQSSYDQLLYGLSESEAKTLRLGLWIDSNAMPPWKWRLGGR